MKRRILSLALALCLLLPLCAPSLAEDLPGAEARMGEASIESIPAAPEGEEPPAAEEPTPEGELAEEDLYSIPALGSAGVQYAGVAYLSQGAFNGLNAEAQEDYVELVDQMTEQLDRGAPIYDIVFANASDGSVSFHFTLPFKQLCEMGEAQFAEPEISAGEEAAEGEVAEGAPVEKALAEGALGDGPIVLENQELAAPYLRAEESGGAGNPERCMALLSDKPGIRELNTLFWKTKDYFKNQLGEAALAYFNAAEKQIVRGGATSCKVSARFNFDAAYSAASALMLTCPEAFDWAWSNGVRFSYSSRGGVTMGFVKSKHYKAKLEAQAREKIQQLVNEAYAYAAQEYPEHITYGIVRFLDEWLCVHSDYNMMGVYGDNQSEVWYYCHVSYGVLLKGYGVCESYAKAMSRLLDAAGIPNIYAVSATHAWNYVQMPDGAFYLQDSTGNDPIGGGASSLRVYLLSGNASDPAHNTNAPIYGNQIFKYPAISRTGYAVASAQPEQFGLDRDAYYVKKGESVQLSAGDGYYDYYLKNWTVGDPSIATVDANGKATGLRPGETTVHMDFNGSSDEARLCVYEFDQLSFQENGKANLTQTCSFNSAEGPKAQFIYLNLTQTERIDSAENIAREAGLELPPPENSKPAVAEASAVVVGDTVVLAVTPRKIGETKIALKFAGKTAKLMLKVREELLNEWFSMAYDSAVYTGKALKPKIAKLSTAPKDLKFSVKYASNTNAGEGVVTITGKGGYGTLEKRFTIQPAPIESKLTIADPKAVFYNGAAQSASPTVKLGKKKLKAGTDYEILYEGPDLEHARAGSYKLRFVGKNYEGEFADGAEHRFVIQPASLTKLSLALKKASVKANGAPVTAEALGLQLKSGKKIIPASEYEVSFRNGKKEPIEAPAEPGSYFVVVTPVGENIVPTAKKYELTKGFKIKKQ